MHIDIQTSMHIGYHKTHTILVDIQDTSTYTQVAKIPKQALKDQTLQAGAYMHAHSLNPNMLVLNFLATIR